MTEQPRRPERGDPTDDELLAADAERRDEDAEVAERVEIERAVTSWWDLLADSIGDRVELVISDGTRLRGCVEQVGDAWCLMRIDEPDQRCALIPLTQVLTVSGLQGHGHPASKRPGMGSALRRWGRQRCDVVVHLVDGSTRRGRVVDVLADGFTVAHGDGTSPPLTISRAAVRWIVGDPFTD